MQNPEQDKPFGKTLADLTDEEYEELCRGVDDYYFGGLQSGRTPEQAAETSPRPSAAEADKQEGGSD
jgi:hypothetical protein